MTPMLIGVLEPRMVKSSYHLTGLHFGSVLGPAGSGFRLVCILSPAGPIDGTNTFSCLVIEKPQWITALTLSHAWNLMEGTLSLPHNACCIVCSTHMDCN